jgi:hypothetical protein
MRAVEIVQAAAGIYVIGVLIGLWRADASPAGRLGLALLWPVGPAAFVVTLATLVVAGTIAAVVRD